MKKVILKSFWDWEKIVIRYSSLIFIFTVFVFPWVIKYLPVVQDVVVDIKFVSYHAFVFGGGSLVFWTTLNAVIHTISFAISFVRK